MPVPQIAQPDARRVPEPWLGAGHRPLELAIVSSHPIQYAAPLYAYLNRDPDLNLTVLYCSDASLRGAHDAGFGRAVAWDVELLAGYEAVFLGPRARTRSLGGFWSLACPELVVELSRRRYDVVWIHGQQFAAYVLAFVLAKLQRLPVMTRTDTHLGLAIGSLRALARRALLGTQYRFIDRFLAVGSANRDYYRALGVPDSRIFCVPFSVDNERFIGKSALAPEERLALRARLGVRDERPVVLFASKLLPDKHPDDVLRAAAKLVAQGLSLHVVVAGSGQLLGALQSLASGLELERAVTFTGFVNQSELPALFAACDIFALPAERESWGLVINEVMCAGLPVVVGSSVGCAVDLVESGVNGELCEAGNPVSLARALEPLVRDPARRRRMGEASRRRIERWGFEQCREGLRAALDGLVRAR